MIRKNKTILNVGIGIVFAFLLIITCNLNFISGTTDKITEYSDDITSDNNSLKISTLSGKIHIDNNWSAAKAALICTGSGTYSDPYVIEDLVIDAGGSGSCIWIQSSTVYFKIENCTVYNSGNDWDDAGIKLGTYVDNGKLVDNNIHDNFVGIFLESCDNNTISGNIISNSTDPGMRVYYSYNNTILGNNADNNDVGIDLRESDSNTISGNIANDNENGISVINCSDITISGNTADNNDGMGMYLEICRDVDVLENDVNNNGWVGMWLGDFSDSTVSGNTINHNAEMGGIALGGWRNIISENTVSYNNYSGIHGAGNINNISKNTVNYNAEHGISFGGGYSIISENIANHNDQFGICINGDYNNVTENTASYNNINGITLDGNSDNCILYLNNIVGNLGDNGYDDGTNNQWDNGTIGNYWDDYSGKDDDDDGIGDTSYTIPGETGSYDNYPIFWDAPIVSIISPIANETFKSNAPEYSISVEGVPITMWYTIEGISGSFNITQLTGTIDQDAWNTLAEGDVTITFYAQDSEDEIGSNSLVVKKSIPDDIPVVVIISVVGISVVGISVVAIIITKKIKK